VREKNNFWRLFIFLAVGELLDIVPRLNQKENHMKAFILIGSLAIILTTGCATNHKRVAWEYRIIQGATHHPDYSQELEKKLNQAGKEGFAIHSSSVSPPEPNRYSTTTFILKRPSP
jgi:hypothetical protein